MQKVWTLLVAVGMFVVGFSADLKQANTLFDAQEYTQAIEAYELLVEQGYSAPELYYNLANSYYKEGLYPSAILNYERALKLNPSYEDALHNLEIANLATIDKIEPLPSLWLSEIWEGFTSTFHSDTWGVITNLSLVIALIGFALFLFMAAPKLKQLGLTIMLISIVFSGIFYGLGKSQQNFENQAFAIVFEKNSYVKHAPSDQSADAFMLHEGTKVEVLDAVKEWYKIQIADGNIGWILKEAIVEI